MGGLKCHNHKYKMKEPRKIRGGASIISQLDYALDYANSYLNNSSELRKGLCWCAFFSYEHGGCTFAEAVFACIFSIFHSFSKMSSLMKKSVDLQRELGVKRPNLNLGSMLYFSARKEELSGELEAERIQRNDVGMTL